MPAPNRHAIADIVIVWINAISLLRKVMIIVMMTISDSLFVGGYGHLIHQETLRGHRLEKIIIRIELQDHLTNVFFSILNGFTQRHRLSWRGQDQLQH